MRNISMIVVHYYKCFCLVVFFLSAVNGSNFTDKNVIVATENNKTFNKTDSDDYYYDSIESQSMFDWYELIPTLVVYGLTMILGICGNSLIIFTIWRYRHMKSTTNVFLSSLASADLLLILICIPVKVAKLFSYTWTMGVFLCKVVHYMQNVSAICSVLTLTAMSIERYYAIVHPMRARYICTISQARKIIICIWILSFLLATPMLFVQVHMLVGERFKAFWCVPDWDNKRLWRFHEVYMLALILIAPTCIMAITYTAICWEIWRVMLLRHDMISGQGISGHLESFPLRYSKRGHRSSSGKHNLRESLRNTNSEEENKTVKQVIKMLVAVVVLFVICWGPLLIDNVLTAYGVLVYLRTGSLKYMRTAFQLMAYFNSCINPLVYGFMSKNFRQSFYQALFRCCRRSRPPKRALSVSQTRTTSVRYADSRFEKAITKLDSSLSSS